MKRIIVFLVLIISTSIIYGQTQIYQAVSFAYKYRTTSGWGDWSKKIPTKAKIYLNRATDEVNVDGENPQSFKIQRIIDNGYNKKNDKYIRFQAVDQNGKLCTIMMIFPTGNKVYSKQIYFIYNEFKIYYNFFDNSNYFDSK
ncbi:hypothetical protein OZ668_05160 [Elizabethkingia sp. HX XZB]|uniref:hypothetical protein n=1 Tax=Elizabethkingia TaxID=308865 RepID=UPI002A2424E4|nr:hypothetical protein [Elizabethkingia sp. HX XZB]MDX8567360.1 hypothetical protein [Elizabethkingia sp. HX XZB]